MMRSDLPIIILLSQLIIYTAETDMIDTHLTLHIKVNVDRVDHSEGKLIAFLNCSSRISLFASVEQLNFPKSCNVIIILLRM